MTRVSKISDTDRSDIREVLRLQETLSRIEDITAWSAAFRREESLYKFVLSTVPVTDESTGATLGNVTYVSDCNSPFRHTETELKSRDRAFAIARDLVRDELDAWHELVQPLRNGMGPNLHWTGEAQYAHDGARRSLPLFKSVRTIRVDPADIAAFRDAIVWRHWRTPNDRPFLDEIMAELDRIEKINVSGRGTLTLAAERVLSGSEAKMILGAMQ